MSKKLNKNPSIFGPRDQKPVFAKRMGSHLALPNKDTGGFKGGGCAPYWEGPYSFFK